MTAMFNNVEPADQDLLSTRQAVATTRPDKPHAAAIETAGASKSDNTSAPEVIPWPEPVSPDELLTEIAATIKRFIVCSEETTNAAALWTAMTWFMDAVNVAPLAVITAPEKRCGKTQMLTVLGHLVCRPLSTSNITPAALFRTIDVWRPTLMIDEADAFMKENEDLRGLINSGHTRDSAYVVRLVGNDHTPKRFNLWGAKAISGIGRLADTLMDRAIVFELRRKLPSESVERLRHAEPELWITLQRKLARFSSDSSSDVRSARPDLPCELHDRAQDNWEPLLQIASVAGGKWPDLARTAALKLSGQDEQPKTVGVELLADIHSIFESKNVDRISTTDLIAALCEDEEKPWATYNKGFPIKPTQVAHRLREYGICSNTIRIGIVTKKGYIKEWFSDAFARYVFNETGRASSSVTPSQANANAGFAVTSPLPVTSCAVTRNTGVTAEPSTHAVCDGVTANEGNAASVGEDEVEI